jgi:hypothetical protein
MMAEDLTDTDGTGGARAIRQRRRYVWGPALVLALGSGHSSSPRPQIRPLQPSRPLAAVARIARIDPSLVDRPTYDLSNEAGRALWLLGNPIAQAYARASSEVLIEGPVPAEAVQLCEPGT